MTLHNELTGICHRPLMDVNNTVLKYYGYDYHRGDPRLFDWQSYAAKSGEQRNDAFE